MCAAWFRAISWSGDTGIQFSRMVLLCGRCHHGRVRNTHPKTKYLRPVDEVTSYFLICV